MKKISGVYKINNLIIIYHFIAVLSSFLIGIFIFVTSKKILFYIKSPLHPPPPTFLKNFFQKYKKMIWISGGGVGCGVEILDNLL